MIKTICSCDACGRLIEPQENARVISLSIEVLLPGRASVMKRLERHACSDCWTLVRDVTIDMIGVIARENVG